MWRLSEVDKTTFSWKAGRRIFKPGKTVRLEQNWVGDLGLHVWGDVGREIGQRTEKEVNSKGEGPLGTR